MTSSSSAARLAEPTYQYSLFDTVRHEPIVNVAAIPLRSPFRYPGGKTWLVPRIRLWLRSLPEVPKELIEPFAGGGITGLTAAFEDLAEHVTLVELDEDIAAVWQTMLSDDAEWLANRIISFSMTPDCIQTELEQTPRSTPHRAFQTLLRNRINHGGILASGSGRLRLGENGKGLASRWYPQTLQKRILSIASIRHKIRFIHGDGMEVLLKNAPALNTACFIDPPYTASGKKAGSRLYTHSQLDHEELFRITNELAGDFLMTYDHADGVKALASHYKFETLPVPMKTTHHAELSELLIGRSLGWA